MVHSWGRAHKFDHQVASPAYLQDTALTSNQASPTTIFGQGRSYGDVALNDGGRIVQTGSLKRIQTVNWETGVIRAEAGMTLDQVLQVSVPRGWFLPVTPGTKYVSLGGAVANDVHGKNHHHVGSFGAHVRKLGLRRSTGEQMLLSREENADLFALTISGLGLTGFIEWVEFQLVPVRSASVIVENIPYGSLDEFYQLSNDSKGWPYVVAWIDCFAGNKALGRGVFSRGKHSLMPDGRAAHRPDPRLTWPIQTPGWLLNRTSIGLFNKLYRHRPGARYCGRVPYDPFFYPLDGIAQWNRLYGARGFYQHQCIVPLDEAKKAMTALLTAINAAGQGSFLAVMKNHGAEKSPGLNTFCLEGTSLALDFANRGDRTLKLLKTLDEIVLKHGGRLYPAKDGTMSAEMYKTGYPNWQKLEDARDPALNSAFWQRVTR